MTNTCNACRWWVRSKDDAEIGDCHRMPPALSDTMLQLLMQYQGNYPNATNSNATNSVFPGTHDNDWCGEFKAMQPETPGKSMSDQEEIEIWNDLSVRAVNCLESVGVTCAKDLLLWSADDLAEIRGLGESSIHKLIQALEEKGLRLSRECHAPRVWNWQTKTWKDEEA